MLTPAQRIRQLEEMLKFARHMQAERIRRYGFDPDAAAEAPE